MDKNTTKLHRIFLHESDKKCKENLRWNILYICGYDLTYAQFKTLNYITSSNLIKTLQNMAQGFFSIKLTKVCHRTRSEVLVSVLFKKKQEFPLLSISFKMGKFI